MTGDDIADALEGALKLMRQPGTKVVIAIAGEPQGEGFGLFMTQVVNERAHRCMAQARAMGASYILYLLPLAEFANPEAQVWTCIVPDADGLVIGLHMAFAKIDVLGVTDSLWLNLIDEDDASALVTRYIQAASATEGSA